MKDNKLVTWENAGITIMEPFIEKYGDKHMLYVIAADSASNRIHLKRYMEGYSADFAGTSFCSVTLEQLFAEFVRP